MELPKELDLAYPPDPFGVVDPRNLRVLVVDSKTSSRQHVTNLLQDCSYQVTGVRTAKEALQLLAEQHNSPNKNNAFDLILKDHEPPVVDACRLLRRLTKEIFCQNIPLVVVSAQDNRDTVMQCLQLGAIDYLVKPLRRNELQNIWTRVWWRRVLLRLTLQTTAAYLQPMVSASGQPQLQQQFERGPQVPVSTGYSTDSKETKCVEEQDPASKEGSAPVGTGSGGNGSKEGNDGSRNLDVKTGHGSNNGNGNSGGSKIGNGCSTSRIGVAGSGNQPAHILMRDDAHGFQRDLRVVASDAFNQNGGSNGANGSGDNGNGTGGTGNFTVQSQQQASHPAATLQTPESEVPSSRGAQTRDYEGNQVGHGFRAWVAPGAQLTGNKRPHSELAQLASMPPRQRYARAGNSNVEPVEAPVSLPHEMSGTGVAVPNPSNPSFPTVGNTITKPSFESFENQSDDTQLQQVPVSAGPPPLPTSAGAPAPPHLVPNADQMSMAMKGMSPALRAVGSGVQRVFWPTPPNSSSLRLKAQAQKADGNPQRPFPPQPPMLRSQQQGEKGVQQGAQFGPNPFLMYPGNPLLPPGLANWGQNWGQGPFTGQQGPMDPQQIMQRMASGQQRPMDPQQIMQRMASGQQGPMDPQQIMQRMASGGHNSYAQELQQQLQQSIQLQQQQMNQLQQQQQLQQQHLNQLQQQQTGQSGMYPTGYNPYFMHMGMAAQAASMAGMQSYWRGPWANPQTYRVTQSDAGPQQSARSAETGKRTVQTQAQGKDDQAVVGQSRKESSSKTLTVDTIVEPTRTERRARALSKYKEKRRNLCFTKKIRYETRKQLADMRPRVKGQFVRLKPTGGEDKDGETNGNSGVVDTSLGGKQTKAGKGGAKTADERAAAEALAAIHSGSQGVAAMEMEEDHGYEDDGEYDEDMDDDGDDDGVRGQDEDDENAGTPVLEDDESPGQDVNVSPYGLHMRSGQASGGIISGRHHPYLSASFGMMGSNLMERVQGDKSNGEASNGRNGKNGSDSGSNSPERHMTM